LSRISFKILPHRASRFDYHATATRGVEVSRRGRARIDDQRLPGTKPFWSAVGRHPDQAWANWREIRANQSNRRLAGVVFIVRGNEKRCPVAQNSTQIVDKLATSEHDRMLAPGWLRPGITLPSR